MGYIWRCLFLTLPLLTSCATPIHQEVRRVKPGMEKAQVLELLGNPQKTRRWKGKDEWTYIYYVSGQRQGTDIHFENGSVIYIGAAQLPSDADVRLENTSDYEDYKQQVKERSKSYNKGFKDLDKQDP